MIWNVCPLTVFSQNGFHLAFQAIGWPEIAGEQNEGCCLFAIADNAVLLEDKPVGFISKRLEVKFKLH